MVIALLFVTAACGGGETAQPAAPENNQGQEAPVEAPEVNLGDVTFVVPYSPGGGFDTLARTIAPYLEKNLPEGTKVIIENVPGGNGVIGVQEVMTAKPDGTTIGIFNMPGFFVEPLLGNADYNLEEVAWIGQASSTTYVAAASPKSGITNLDGLKALAEVKGGMAGLTDSAAVGALAAADTLGFNLKAVSHKGSTEGILSAIRGDTQFVQFPFGSLTQYIVDSKELTPLWVYSEERLPELPEVPTIVEMGHPELLGVVSLRRTIGTTPGTPDEVLTVLREALAKSMKDPELLKIMNDADMEPEYLDAAATLEKVKEMKVTMEQYKDLFTAK